MRIWWHSPLKSTSIKTALKNLRKKFITSLTIVFCLRNQNSFIIRQQQSKTKNLFVGLRHALKGLKTTFGVHKIYIFYWNLFINKKTRSPKFPWGFGRTLDRLRGWPKTSEMTLWSKLKSMVSNFPEEFLCRMCEIARFFGIRKKPRIFKLLWFELASLKT